MGARKKPLRPVLPAEHVSRRLSYRLRREHYAEMGQSEAAPATETPPPAVSRVLAEREQQIAKLTQDNAALRDLVLRARADLDNARKRFQREKSETVKYATEQLTRELVVVLDNLERALQSADSGADVKAVRDGIQMVLDSLLGILQSNGLQVIASDGHMFDPHFHEAVSADEREDAVDNQIVATFQKGYMLRGRVVRPAMVRVGRALRLAPPVAEPAAAESEAIAPAAVTPAATGDETIADLDDLPQTPAPSAAEPPPGDPSPSPDP
jgi:molecular chaperone GrpE